MLRQRVLTAAVLLPLVIGPVFLADGRWLAAVLGVGVGLGAWEWSRLAGLGARPARLAYLLAVALALAACYRWRGAAPAGAVVAAGAAWWLAALGLIMAAQGQILRLPGPRWLGALAGFAVLVPSWFSLVLLHERNGPGLVLVPLCLTWIADIAAYFCGRRWGRRRLASRISPGKTWAGAYGALSAGLAAGAGFALLMNMQLFEGMKFIVLSGVTVAASMVGDLYESLMKRGAGLKDSGRLLPGHGGMLDRIDSLTAACPVFLAGGWAAGLLA